MLRIPRLFQWGAQPLLWPHSRAAICRAPSASRCRGVAVAVSRKVCGQASSRQSRGWMGRLSGMLHQLCGRVSPVLPRSRAGANPRLLLMGGVAFLWERERISNEDVIRCLKGHEERMKQFRPSQYKASPIPDIAIPELRSPVPNAQQQATPRIESGNVVTSRSRKKITSLEETTMYDFMVAAKATMEEHSVRHLAELPLVGMKRERGRRTGYKRSGELYRKVLGGLWSSRTSENTLKTAKEKQRDDELKMEDCREGVPLHTNPVLFLSLSVAGYTITSAESPDTEHESGDVLLSLEEVCGTLCVQPGVVVGRGEKGVWQGAPEVPREVPLVGLGQSPSSSMYDLSFKVVAAFKAGRGAAVSKLNSFSSAQKVQSSPSLQYAILSHQVHLATHLFQQEVDYGAVVFYKNWCLLPLPPAVTDITNSKILLSFFKVVHKLGRTSDRLLEKLATGAEKKLASLSSTQTGRDSKTESDMSAEQGVPEEVVHRGKEEVEFGSVAPSSSGNASLTRLGVSEVEGVGDDGGGLDGWEFIAEETDCTVYRKPFRDTGLFQYKVIGHYSDITSRDFLFVQLDHSLRRSWDSYVVTLETVDRDARSDSEIVHWVMKFPFPMSCREYLYVRRAWISPNNDAIVIMNRAVEHPGFPVVRKYVRVGHYFSEMIIKPHTHIDQDGLDFELTYFDNPQSYLPSSCVNWVTTTAMPDFLTKMHSAALNCRHPPNLSSDPQSQTDCLPASS